jgi:hypothetical protein
MLDLIKKWWNRKWSNWEEYQIITKTFGGREIGKDLILKRVSSDGNIQYKKIKTY